MLYHALRRRVFMISIFDSYFNFVEIFFRYRKKMEFCFCYCTVLLKYKSICNVIEKDYYRFDDDADDAPKSQKKKLYKLGKYCVFF